MPQGQMERCRCWQLLHPKCIVLIQAQGDEVGQTYALPIVHQPAQGGRIELVVFLQSYIIK